MDKLIYDVGAHKGEDTDYYLKKGFRVVAIEANPELADRLSVRFAHQIDAGQLIVVDAAVSDTEGQVEFYANEALSVWGTINPTWAQRNLLKGAPSRTIRVRSVVFDRLLHEHGIPHYLKIDIEGADMLCVEALYNFTQRPRYISLESTKTSWMQLKSEFDALTNLGYTKFKIIDQSSVTYQIESTPASEGVCVGHQFTPGSTGLFGADLPGEWISKNQALIRYAWIFVKYKLFGDNTIGERLIRKFNIARRLLPSWYDTHAMHASGVSEKIQSAASNLKCNTLPQVRCHDANQNFLPTASA